MALRAVLSQLWRGWLRHHDQAPARADACTHFGDGHLCLVVEHLTRPH